MGERILWVELLGVTLSGSGGPDAGFTWTDLEGWRGLPDARGDADSIPGGHGRFRRSKIVRESRVMTLSGAIIADDAVGLEAACARFESALAAGAGSMRVATDSGIWERWVEIDTLRIDPDHGRRWTCFVVDMIAPDPRKYGPLQTVGPAVLQVSTGGVRLPKRMPWNFGSVSAKSRLLIANSGGIPVLPRIRVEGGFSHVSVVDVTAGKRLRLEWEVPEGEELVLDCRLRRAEVRSSELTRWMTRREWFEVPVGATHELRFEVDGAVGEPKMWADFRIGEW